MSNSLATVNPELISEWSDKNYPLTPDKITFGSNKKVWWIGSCGHEWEATVKSRTINGTGCPYCSHNKVLEGFNDLASQFPKVAAEWSDKNLPLKPTMVTAFANSKAWWKCRDCGHEWEALISTRSGGSKCPYCSGYTLLKGFNDLTATNPEISAEWSERNYPLKPYMINAKSRKNVWWKCKTCGYEWKSVVYARVKGTVCPVCAERKVLKGHNDLATTDAELLEEWDYKKNDILPTQLLRTSKRIVWWRCSLGHSWRAKVDERAILGGGCKICEDEYRSVFPSLVFRFYASQHNLNVEYSKSSTLGIPLEMYIPDEHIAFETRLDSPSIEALREHLCNKREIKLIRVLWKANEIEAEYAERVKSAFKRAHIFITSNSEEDVKYIRQRFMEWRKTQ